MSISIISFCEETCIGHPGVDVEPEFNCNIIHIKTRIVTAINKIICPIFDFPLMAKLALGRTHWPKLTPPQRDKFTQLFVERLKTSYREKVALYTNEEAIFKPALRDKKNLRVSMELISNEKRVAVLYKLRKVDERWKIYDVEIQGVSIILTYRSQFDDILHNGSVEDLLSRLENPTTP